ncbi:MAG: sigma 54-interacting transcriptional regulator [Clostridia bacterium]|nr:sigma 54-interacting transcriptional regulator [Clostridia bacterium]
MTHYADMAKGCCPCVVNHCGDHVDSCKEKDRCLQGKLQKAYFLNKEFEAIIESSFDGIGILSADGTLLKVNSSYRRITGLLAQDCGVGRKVAELEQEGHVSQAVGVLVLKYRQPVTIRQKIKTGKEVLITGSPVFDEEGEVFRIVCNIRDLSELNNLRDLVEKSRNINDLYARELKELRALQLAHEDIIFRSQGMKLVLEMARKVAKVQSNVLITGESGVGKEIIAKIIHKLSVACAGPFMQINCGAIPENLLESELFGYEDGAFTGARTGGKPGVFELCNGGSLLLDEIGEMPLHLQVKLLRAIQNKEILRVGGSKPHIVDVRIIAATNKNLEQMVEEKTFRADLFYRLNVVPIKVPPLRDRVEDIVPLILHFLEKFNMRYGSNKRMEPEVYQTLEQYSWSGNVRELENLVERLVVITDEQLIKHTDLPAILHNPKENDLEVKVNRIVNMQTAQEELEKELIAKSLRTFSSIRQAANALGVSHPTIIRKMQKYGLNGQNKG